MKKIFIVLLYCISATVFCQTYHFDYFIKEVIERIKPESVTIKSELFYDSKSQNELGLRVSGEKILGILYFRKEGVRHVFSVKQEKNEIAFTYKHSTKFTKKQQEKNSSKDVINVIQRDSLNYHVDVFTNSKKKKPYLTVDVTLKESEVDYIKIRADYNQTNEIEERIKSFLNKGKRYTVSKIKIKYSSGYEFESRETPLFQNTNLTLTVPEKLIIKDYDYWKEFED